MITALYRVLHLLGWWRLSGCFRHQSERPDEGAGWPPARRTNRPRRPSGLNRRVNHLRSVSSDAGMTTAEYAVGTVAAVAFAVVLFKVVQSPAVHSALASVVTGALHVKM
jgi:uncharacterized protein DUF4244